nr:YqgE/AlgH family protein [Paraferrimonas sp. SM1919]
MRSLRNHFLIAMPSLDESYFKRSVVYIFEHDDQGAMGLVVNHPIGLKSDSLLRQMKLKDESFKLKYNPEVMAGGPVSQERGFVLHDNSKENNWDSTIKLSDELSITTSKDILQSLGEEHSPEKFIIALGYSGWSEGQLEQELLDNTWLTVKADADIIFNQDINKSWQAATRSLGIDPATLSNETGRA